MTDDKPTITDDKLTSILAFLKLNGPCRRKDISAMLGLKPTQTKAYLYKLLEQGKIVAHGANRKTTVSAKTQYACFNLFMFHFFLFVLHPHQEEGVVNEIGKEHTNQFQCKSFYLLANC